MTEQEIQAEKKYIYNQRIGMLCGEGKPTPEEIEIAVEEAEAFEKTARAANATPAEP